MEHCLDDRRAVQDLTAENVSSTLLLDLLHPYQYLKVQYKLSGPIHSIWYFWCCYLSRRRQKQNIYGRQRRSELDFEEARSSSWIISSQTEIFLYFKQSLYSKQSYSEVSWWDGVRDCKFNWNFSFIVFKWPLSISKNVRFSFSLNNGMPSWSYMKK